MFTRQLEDAQKQVVQTMMQIRQQHGVHDHQKQVGCFALLAEKPIRQMLLEPAVPEVSGPSGPQRVPRVRVELDDLAGLSKKEVAAITAEKKNKKKNKMVPICSSQWFFADNAQSAEEASQYSNKLGWRVPTKLEDEEDAVSQRCKKRRRESSRISSGDGGGRGMCTLQQSGSAIIPKERDQ